MATIGPPFTAESAARKVKFAQDLWNTRDPAKVIKGYSSDTIWRNRDSFLNGTAEVASFLEQKWAREQSYRLRKEMFAWAEDRIAVQFWYEYQDAQDGMKWKRCYGLEDWTFRAEDGGKMWKRMMCGNDVVLGLNGDGAGDGKGQGGSEGRWFKDGTDENDADISNRHW